MRFFNIFSVVLPLIFSTTATAQELELNDFYGTPFKMEQEKDEAAQIYKALKPNDSIQTQLTGKITEVCQAKGCWMKVTTENQQEVFVRFKDYGFFVPINSSNKKVVMNGIAFLEEMSVEDQKHYAKDRGASNDELARITVPKRMFRFEADGVLIEKNH